MINRILFITLSNFGDVVLTLPVLDVLREKFPAAKITVMVGPRPKEIFEGNSFIDRLIVYDKYAPLREKVKLFFSLKKERFDVIIDLRNTLFGALLPCRFRTSPFLHISARIKHMQERNLYRLYKALKMREGFDFFFNSAKLAKKSLTRLISKQDIDYIDALLEKNGIFSDKDKIIIVAPISRGANRRWEKEKFAEVCKSLSEDYKVILAGELSDKAVTQYISDNCQGKARDFAGLTSLKTLAYLIQKASLVIVCDTGILHLASYLGIPVLGVFGAGDEKKYRPWSAVCAIVKKDIFCRPCLIAQCRFKTLDCLRLIKPQDVLRKARSILTSGQQSAAKNQKNYFRRILIVRTDRMGDVVLSTPVIKALRDEYPDAYIAMMISPYTREIVENNPYLDDVIIYDKDSLHKTWFGSFRFAVELKKKRFDLCLILHPTNRSHLVTFFAGIPKRVGYNRKLGFLLTHRIKHTKQAGEKHELEYNLDLIRVLGIAPKDKNLFIPVSDDSENWAKVLFIREGFKDSDKILAIHPGASCPSKIWPIERFAEAADQLIKKCGFKVIVLGGGECLSLAQNLTQAMTGSAVNLAGKTSISQLTSILKRCALFITNDSGPVHIAVAVGTPVISIFGRNQKGLSPKRWGPLGKEDRFLHKEVGCVECLAHNCKKEFTCLKAISVEEVIEAASVILRNSSAFRSKSGCHSRPRF
ncbi:MAG: lipopolysaccharide heptosyltransferase II, partial [Candidatus Omnitrophota bacterium]|nr:lipopolysaccharide heptosyltransferase II [Candidatus Omnitrophota bacterium]